MAARPIPVNATAAAILGLLHDGPMTGGELVAAAGERFGGFFSVTRSQVYRELPALAEAGLLRLGKLGPRASQQYRINAAGKRSFRAWLAGPGGADALRSPLVLRLLYAERAAPRTTAPSWWPPAAPPTPSGSRKPRRPSAAAESPYERAVGGVHRGAPRGHAHAARRHRDRHPDRAGGHRVAWSVVNADAAADIKELSSTLESIEAVSDLPALRTEIADLEDQAGQPDLWNDQEKAQKVTSRLSHAQGELRRIEDLRRGSTTCPCSTSSPRTRATPSAIADADADRAKLREEIAALEVRTLLSGEYDEREALVTIRSEAGGVDAADFAEMLMRMYLRWAERHGYPTEVYDTSYAEEAGIKSATFQVHAPFAYGTLSVEQGTHRLVRISPFDNQGRRQTSFAGVEVVPVVETTDHVDIDEKDLRVDVYRSSGPGGQGVNTTDSAVRITHLPTGIVVSCQNERSQIQNRASAMVVLQAKLLERRRQEERALMDALKDTGTSWGNQMRSYVLHPYQMVKDLRTEYEVGNPTAVLDGDIDGFIEAGIRWRRNQD